FTCGSKPPARMIRLRLETFIAAPVTRCFDLARSIDLHVASTNWTGERAIAGVTSGLIGLGQEVTWKGRHFGLKLQRTGRITAYARAHHFQDCVLRGRSKSFCHDHYFESQRILNRTRGYRHARRDGIYRFLRLRGLAVRTRAAEIAHERSATAQKSGNPTGCAGRRLASPSRVNILNA